ncbi:MAG: HRDC domain-containing protein [Pseudomonadota bacterium]
MKLKVFAVPATGDDNAESALNLFMAQHRVLHVDRQLIQNGSASFWSVCIGYSEKQTETRKQQSSNRVDYRHVLSATDFRDFAALREWRKEIAESEGIPVFGVFSNEQLAAIVQLSDLTLSALRRIDGVGEKKVERYGKPVLSLLENRRSETGNIDNSASADRPPAKAEKHEA